MEENVAPYVSVIIPTLHREEPLRQVLKYFLDSESYSPFEVIVVDQSDRHEPATVEYLASINDRIRLVQITKRGAANARNHGARMARGSLLLFVDDDDLPRANFIRGHVGAHQDSGIAAVCGAVLRPGNRLRTREELTSEELATIRLHRGGLRDVDFPFECSWGSTSNLSVKAEWFSKVGGFYSHENAGVASGGLNDALFGHVLRHRGGRILYSPLPAIVIGRAETGGCRDLVDSGQRRVLELENALNFWARIGNSRVRAIQTTFRRLVIRRSIPQTATNLWAFVKALARWSLTTRVE
ncbi:MAG: glycosyltransferase family 2 protein [Candidatus Rokuibacteriota bacterium]